MATPRIGLPEILPNQAQKHITHNDALVILDALVQGSVISRTLTTPPGSPTDGDAYVVAATATGAWAGKENDLAVYEAAAWSFYTPLTGYLMYCAADGEHITFDGSAWLSFTDALPFLPSTGGNISGDVRAPGLGVGGATPDALNKFAFYGTNMLFHSVASIDATFSKGGAGDDASFSFKTGFSTRAITGLLGSDDYSIKVSSDGSTFKEALVVDSATGAVDLPSRPFISVTRGTDVDLGAVASYVVEFESTMESQGGLSLAADGLSVTVSTSGLFLIHGTFSLESGVANSGDAYLPAVTVNGSPIGIIQDSMFAPNAFSATGSESSGAITHMTRLSPGDSIALAVTSIQSNSKLQHARLDVCQL